MPETDPTAAAAATGVDDAPASPRPPPPTRAEVAQLAAVLAVWCGIAAYATFRLDGFFGVDAYFHITLAEKLAEHGLRMQTFSWAAYSVWNDSYFDKEWLFHVILRWVLPFGRETGPKLLVVAMNAGIVASMWWVARGLWRQRGYLWLLLTLVAALGINAERIMLVRPHVLSVIFLFVCIGAMLYRRPVVLAITMLLYAWSHTGHWQMVGLALVYDCAYALFTDDGRLRPRREWRRLPLMTLVVAGVTVGAAILHPHFPVNVKGLWIQNVLVVTDYAAGGDSAVHGARPQELRHLPLDQLWRLLGLVLAAHVAVLIHAIKTRVRQPRALLVMAVYSLMFFVMMLLIRRFYEYWVPTSVLLIVGYCLQHNLLRGLASRWKALAAVAIVGLTVATALRSRETVVASPRFQESGDWIAHHLEPDEIVFTASWSQPPALFYVASQQRFLVFLDPMFMYRRDPEVYVWWDRTRFGKIKDDEVTMMVRNYFHSRCVFVTTPNPTRPSPTDRFYDQLMAAPDARLVARDFDGGCVFLLADHPLPPPPAEGEAP